MMTVGSLFAGIGGIDLGLERAGMRTFFDYTRLTHAPSSQSLPAGNPRTTRVRVRGARRCPDPM